MKGKEYISLEKMIEYIDRAVRYTEGYTFESFCADDKTVDATVFSISQIRWISKEFSLWNNREIFFYIMEYD